MRTAELLPIVVTPYRIQSKRGFWTYCGLGVVTRSSSDWVRTQTGEWMKAEVKRTRGLNRNFNHTLKAIFRGAATTVIGRAEDGTPTLSGDAIISLVAQCAPELRDHPARTGSNDIDEFAQHEPQQHIITVPRDDAKEGRIGILMAAFTKPQRQNPPALRGVRNQ